MNFLATIASLLLIGVAPDSTHSKQLARERVDMIELNHFIDGEGREVFRQVIFYDWSKPHKQFHVRAWRLIKKPSQLPQHRWNPEHYRCRWQDDDIMREVWSPTMRETWTQRDPERVNRTLLPEDQRVPLWTPQIVASSSRPLVR
jgi:hypothetical protein